MEFPAPERGPSPAASFGAAPPELLALVACARADEGPELRAARRRALAAPGLDLEALLARAERHRLFPLLFAAVARDAADLVPAEWLGRLRGMAHANALRARFLAAETARLVELGATRGFTLVAYKGSMLAARAYADPDLRAVGDIDLMIARRDRPAVHRLLLADGYEPVAEPEVRELLRLEPRRRIEESYVKPAPHLTIALDLHWEFFRGYWPFALAYDALLTRSVEVELEGRRLRAIGPEDLLLVLCAHGTKHLWARLAWLVDIDRFVRAHPALDWDTVVTRARELGAARLLGVTLRLSERLFATPLPEAVDAELAADAPAIDRLVAGRLADLAASALEDDVVLFHPFHHEVRERRADRAAYLRHWYLTRYLSLTWLRNALRPNQYDREFVRLPAGLSFLYLLVRPLRLAARALRRAA